jgi:predicted nucleic acid-binding protein
LTVPENQTVLLDTSVLINFLHRKREPTELLRHLVMRGVTLAVSCVTVAELFAGMRENEETATEELLLTMDCLPVTAEIARRAGIIRAAQRRLGRTFALDDMMIAATAIQYGCQLITDNRKDFEVPGVELFPPF